MSVTKQGYQWPFQTYEFIKLHPTNYTFDLQAMSAEKMEFILPGVFTIGPKASTEAIMKYAQLLGNDQVEIDVLVRGILEGETRILSAQMTIDQIFSDRQAFKDILINAVQKELDQFGLQIYNANIKELQDSPGSEYFSFIRQKKRSEAENRAKVDVAEAKKIGDIGAKEREALTRQQVIQYESETVIRENERAQEMERSKADLAVVKSEAYRKTQVANIEAHNAANLKETDLQRELEQRRIAMEIEKLRARDLSKAQVQAETSIEEAKGIANSLRLRAEGEAVALRLRAEAELYAKQKEADGILALLNAQSSGVQNLIQSFHGNPETLIKYLMMDKGLYERLADANAQAIKGLNPKITIWSTGAGADDNYAKPIADVLKMVPPLMSTIHDQTGIKPPTWIADMSESRVQN
jgi:flotillin